ncbi:hypothetical protein BT93_L4572 [Corymbia citriodora subsp. variegata]|uniref:Uncharacterized protein n=1 Tax=Corymbia citriodora subsp. variegata TaxID=360336 RepID=A0A8T0CXF5_CORYI|nr:hypothetical protein BT93_L4572 [Corymbia citriodora subsp. variegata]
MAGNRLRSGMELFRDAKTVRLWSQDGRYLVAEGDEVIALRDEETRQRDKARWSVEFDDHSDSILRLKSCYGKYLTASDKPFLSDETSRKVLQSPPFPLDSSFELEPVMEGTHAKLRTCYGTFLCTNGDNPLYPDSITHDLPHLTAILWDVEVVERELSPVLELKDENVRSIPEDWFNQTDAVALILKNPSIEVIPDSIGKLEHLEILNAKHSLVTELPPDVAKLDKMRDILIYHYERGPLIESPDLIGFKASCSVKGFKCLEKLCFAESDIGLLNNLGNLTELRRLGITKFRKEHGESLCTSLGKLKKLKSLNIHALDQVEILDLHYQTSPPKSLRHLYLHGRLEKLPDWISSRSLQYLTKLILRWSHLEGDLLKTLGELPKLVELQLHRAYDGEQLNFEDKQFLKLKILLLHELEGLRSMSLAHGTLPSLEILTISRCQWLEEIPSGIKHIHAKKLTLSDMSHEFYEKAKADHGKDNYQIFEHIDEVYFARWKAGYWETHTFPQTKDTKASQVN